jgi:hypothetical protein
LVCLGASCLDLVLTGQPLDLRSPTQCLAAGAAPIRCAALRSSRPPTPSPPVPVFLSRRVFLLYLDLGIERAPGKSTTDTSRASAPDSPPITITCDPHPYPVTKVGLPACEVLESRYPPQLLRGRLAYPRRAAAAGGVSGGPATMSWILPKGIVVNSPQVQGSIERINTEPLDLADIAKFWKGTASAPFG